MHRRTSPSPLVCSLFVLCAVLLSSCVHDDAPTPVTTHRQADTGGCALPSLSCDGVCRDLAHDPANCGACGQTCAAGELCSMGVCASRCDATDTACGSRCVDTRIDPDHCSACGRVCPPAPANAIRACSDSICGFFCAPGYSDCDASATNGCEVDLRVTAAHCGACGRACALPHATSGCAAGACAVASCDAGWVECNGDPSDGCELQDGAACPLTGLCATAVTGCYEHRPVCFATSLFARGTPCRASVGTCDVAEACDGVNPMCPPDSVVGDTTCPSALRGEGTTTAMVAGALECTRHIVSGLRPPLLDQHGLAAAAEWLAQRLEETTQVRCTIDLGDDGGCSPEVSVAAYRVLQESLTNVARHAGAKNVAIQLRVIEGHLTLEVRDDGRGFPTAGAEAKANRNGLFGMRERAFALGGALTTDNAPGGGARVRMRLPVKLREAGGPS